MQAVLAAETGGGNGSRRQQQDDVATDESRRYRLLVVEDEFLTVLDIRYALEDQPFDIAAEVGTAKDAVAGVERYRPDLLLMDVRLGGPGDGVDAALEIYRRFGLRCLFATANADQRTRARAAPSHPLGWLAKPYSDRQLVQSLKSACAQID